MNSSVQINLNSSSLKHKSFLYVVFPFQLSKCGSYKNDKDEDGINLDEICDIKDERFSIWNSFVNETSKHFDYIENMFTSNQRSERLGIAYHLNNEQEFEDDTIFIEQDIMETSHYENKNIRDLKNIFFEYLKPVYVKNELLDKIETSNICKINEFYEKIKEEADIIIDFDKLTTEEFEKLDNLNNISKMFSNFHIEGMKILNSLRGLKTENDRKEILKFSSCLKEIKKYEKTIRCINSLKKYFNRPHESILNDLFIICFKSGISFIGLKFKLGYITQKINPYKEYFDVCLTLRDYFKHVDIEKLIKLFLSNSKKFKIDFFDKCKKLEKEVYSYRFSVLGNIQIDIKKYNDGSLNLNNLKKIANWECDVHSIRNNEFEEEIKNISLYYNNFVTCTEDGLCYLTFKDNYNSDVIKKLDNIKDETKNVFQKVLFSYILNLHQYFYLHKLRKEMMEMNLNGDTKAKDFILLNKQLATFKAKYYFVNVSQITYLQKLYTYMSKQLNILQFHDELEKSIQPLYNIIEQIRKNILDRGVKFFTTTTLVNAFISIQTFIIDSIFCQYKNSKLVIIIRVILIFIFIFIYFLMLKRVNSIKLKNTKNK